MRDGGAGTGLSAALAEAQATGVLPITSVCNVACIFCSNPANPRGVRVFRVGPRPLDDIRHALSRMSHFDEVVIGESASTISEGEPLTHPSFREVIKLVRAALPSALIKLTTNGTLLTRDTARFLARHGPVEVTLSLNTASPEAYRLLHGSDCDPRRGPRALAAAGLPYFASIVAVPAVSGPRDLAATVRFAGDTGCLHCRVLVPGYTRLTRPEVVRLLPSRPEVARLVDEVRARTSLPLSLEPPDVEDLEARVTGVIRGTPADRAGLKAGDVVVAVGGNPAVSRVDAFRRCRAVLRAGARCSLVVRRGGATFDVALEPSDAGRPGLVMDWDVDPADLETIRRLVAAFRASERSKVVVLTSSMGAPPLQMAFGAAGQGRLGPDGPPPGVRPVPSRTFGGSIGCAGLLTVDDVAAVLSGHEGRESRVGPGDLVFLPPSAFDRRGLDLLGRGPGELVRLLPKGARLVVPGLASFGA